MSSRFGKQPLSANAVVKVNVKRYFSEDDKIWEHGFIAPTNCDTFTIAVLGFYETYGDGSEQFEPIWMIILSEDGEETYSGCPEDFRSLSTEDNSFFAIATSHLDMSDDDHLDYNVIDALHNLILFSDPKAAAPFSKEYRAFTAIGSFEIEIDQMKIASNSADRLLLYVCRQVAKFPPISFPNRAKAVKHLKVHLLDHSATWNEDLTVAGAWIRSSKAGQEVTDEDIPDLIAELEELFWRSLSSRKDIDELRRKLDYSPASLVHLDSLIFDLWENSGPSDQSFNRVVSVFGSYVARIIEQQYEGYWCIDADRGWAYQVLKSENVPGVRIAPFGMMHKRLRKEEMLADKYQKLLEFIEGLRR